MANNGLYMLYIPSTCTRRHIYSQNIKNCFIANCFFQSKAITRDEVNSPKENYTSSHLQKLQRQSNKSK